MIRKNSVLLLKSQTSNGTFDKYEDSLTSNGFKVSQIKTLDFDFKNIDILRERLGNSNDYAGIILSSPRCVQAVHLALNDSEGIIHNWQKKQNFVIGEATYEEALQKLYLKCEGKESGNAVNLSKVILQRKSLINKPFLFPHGNLKTGTLKLELGKEGLSIEGVLVYDTLANPNIEDEIANVTENFISIPEYLVFFSPSGLHSSIFHLKKVPVDFNRVKFVAIGPVTDLAIKQENYTVYGTARDPTPKAILDAILDVKDG